jgi:hypothetical protein
MSIRPQPCHHSDTLNISTCADRAPAVRWSSDARGRAAAPGFVAVGTRHRVYASGRPTVCHHSHHMTAEFLRCYYDGRSVPQSGWAARSRLIQRAECRLFRVDTILVSERKMGAARSPVAQDTQKGCCDQRADGGEHDDSSRLRVHQRPLCRDHRAKHKITHPTERLVGLCYEGLPDVAHGL